MCASEKGMTGMVEKLLAAGAKVETTDKVEGERVVVGNVGWQRGRYVRKDRRR